MFVSLWVYLGVCLYVHACGVSVCLLLGYISVGACLELLCGVEVCVSDVSVCGGVHVWLCVCVVVYICGCTCVGVIVSVGECLYMIVSVFVCICVIVSLCD